MMTEKENQLSLEQANQRIYLVDSQGLVVKSRTGLNAEKLPYAHDHPAIKDLKDIVTSVQPTCLFGVAAIPNSFTPEVCKAMGENNARPLIFALSNPTSKAECTAETAYRNAPDCTFASGSPFDPIEIDGRKYVPGQGKPPFILPSSTPSPPCTPVPPPFDEEENHPTPSRSADHAPSSVWNSSSAMEDVALAARFGMREQSASSLPHQSHPRLQKPDDVEVNQLTQPSRR
jgi:hypothetical protein